MKVFTQTRHEKPNRSFQGAIFPSTNVLLSKWAPATEKARMNSFVLSGTQFGSLAMLPTTGLLASSAGGWPSVFYASGAVALLWVLFWCLLGANSPTEHPSISESEREYIVGSLNDTMSKKVNRTLLTLCDNYQI